MREWTEIVTAFDRLAAENKPSALATVVHVEGSAYRRPGARMLIAEDGRTWGGVSGGCLERDVADRGRGVIATGSPFLQRYDTTDEELIERGVSTGCGGTIEVLLQPLGPSHAGMVDVLRDVVRNRRTRRVATVFDHGDGRSVSRMMDLDAEPLPSEDSSRALVETLRPPQRLVVVGGGPDAVPVVTIAKTLGWHVAVVAALPALLFEARFAGADEKYVTGALSPLDGVPLDADDAVVVMTHNLARDGLALAAIGVRPRYLGLLGPRHRTARVLGPLPPGHPARWLHSPVGLDLGSNTPEEIALSIVAEIQSCLRHRRSAAEWRAETIVHEGVNA